MSLDQFIGKFCVIRRTNPTAQFGTSDDGIYFVTDHKTPEGVCAVKHIIGPGIHIHHDFWISDEPAGFTIHEFSHLGAFDLEKLKANLQDMATLGSMGNDINERAKGRLREVNDALATRAKLDGTEDEDDDEPTLDAIEERFEDVSSFVDGFELPEGCNLQVTLSFPHTEFGGITKNVYCHTLNEDGDVSQLLLVPTV